MEVKVLQNAQREHSALRSIFIKLPFLFKTFIFVYFDVAAVFAILSQSLWSSILITR